MCAKNDEEYMPMKYMPFTFEEKWREKWRELKTYRTVEPSHNQRKFYCLDFFPYPSGAGLSVGHGKNYVPSDVVSRYHRMKGDAVLHPMGWDAFGLPAENEAIKEGTHPAESTAKYAAHYKYQLDMLGCSYDWEREINSSDPMYYRWNQYMFLKLYEKGMAYRGEAPVNWCASCQTVLAAEEIEDGSCWRCHQPVVIQKHKQWFIDVTNYAEELNAELDILDWPEHIVSMQRNWIGRSEGVEIKLQVPPIGEITIFTTRVDTLFGVTFIALSPEHPLTDNIATPAQYDRVRDYVQNVMLRTAKDRQTHTPDGVPTGRHVLLPWGGRVPVFIADYVIASHGTGAIMGVPAHDVRDYAFAQQYGIPLKQVIVPAQVKSAGIVEIPYTEYGELIESHQFDGMPSQLAQTAITDWLVDNQIGQQKVHYRLRDWLISRQRYWGTPIPIVHCTTCGEVPVPINQLPVLLPAVPIYQPRGDARAPLANVPEFVNTVCPRCGENAERETDTMTGFVCSSWYYLRFADPHNHKSMFDEVKVARWLPVDIYIGGSEHAVGHLLYSRFWTKFLADAGFVSFREPFPILRSQGVLHIRNKATGRVERMSKSKGNVVTPESVINVYGADIVRLYLLFMGPVEANVVWEVETDGSTPQHIEGVRRFVNRVWRLCVNSSGQSTQPDSTVENLLYKQLNETIEVVTENISNMHFNVAISALMSFTNDMERHCRASGLTPAFLECRWFLLKLLAPFAPFVTEELWHRLGGAGSIHYASWPEWQVYNFQQDAVEIPVQVNGKVRTTIQVSPDIDKAALKSVALTAQGVQSYIENHTIRKVIVVPQRVINIVVD